MSAHKIASFSGYQTVSPIKVHDVVHLGQGRHSSQEPIVEVLCVETSFARKLNTCCDLADTVYLIACSVAPIAIVDHFFKDRELSVATARATQVASIIVCNETDILNMKEVDVSSLDSPHVAFVICHDRYICWNGAINLN